MHLKAAASKLFSRLFFHGIFCLDPIFFLMYLLVYQPLTSSPCPSARLRLHHKHPNLRDCTPLPDPSLKQRRVGHVQQTNTMSCWSETRQKHADQTAAAVDADEDSQEDRRGGGSERFDVPVLPKQTKKKQNAAFQKCDGSSAATLRSFTVSLFHSHFEGS